MTQDVANALKSLFLSLWTLLGSLTIPGTNLTGQHVLVAPLGALAFITILKKILDIGGVAMSHGWRVSPGASSSGRPENDNKGQED